MNVLRQTLLTAFAATLMAVAASATTLTLNPTADGYLRADQPTAPSPNPGTATELLVGQVSATTAVRALVSFDLSSIPVNATINSVSLLMVQSSEDGSSSNTTITLELHALTQTYVESQATWNNAATGTAWTTAGGTFDSTVLSTVDVRVRPSQTPVITLPVNQTWGSTGNFVTAVQSAADGSNSIAFLFKDANETNVARELIKFFSKEGTTAPQLTIDYTVAAIPEPSAIALLMGTVTLAGGVWLRRRSC